jgi:hypothetical protein
LFLTKNAEKSADESVVNWASYSFKERQAFYNSYLAQSGHIGQHGRIDGEAYILCVTQFDEKGLELIDPIFTSPASLESRSGCLGKQVSRIFDFNTRVKNRLNSLFGGIFKTNLIKSNFYKTIKCLKFLHLTYSPCLKQILEGFYCVWH